MNRKKILILILLVTSYLGVGLGGMLFGHWVSYDKAYLEAEDAILAEVEELRVSNFEIANACIEINNKYKRSADIYHELADFIRAGDIAGMDAKGKELAEIADELSKENEELVQKMKNHANQDYKYYEADYWEKE